MPIVCLEMARIWLHDAVLLDPEAPAPAPGSLLIEAGRIEASFPAEAAPPEGAERVSLAGRAIAPGFLDLHYHGRLIFSRPDDAACELARAARRMLRHGVTGFLPTTVAWPAERLMTHVSIWAERCDARHNAGDDAHHDAASASLLGLHLEGPWIRPEAAGAQPKDGIRPFDPTEGAEILDRGEGQIRMVTLAPEAEGAPQLQAELARRGIVASLGHSHAGIEHTEPAIEAGASHATHLFNAMGGLHHRELGLAGVALSDDRLTCDLICDGIHVHPNIVRTAALAKRDRLVLITDRVEPIGAGDGARDGANDDAGHDASHGSYDAGFGAGAVHDDGTALRLADGTLAGSSLSLDRAVRNAVAFGAMTRHEAIQAVTLRPARVLGLEAERGTFRPGARADLVVLDAADQVVESWLGGVRF